MSWGNSHLSSASSHGNGSAKGQLHPPNLSRWTLQKEQKPQGRASYCVSLESRTGRRNSYSNWERRSLLTIWLILMWAFWSILLGMQRKGRP